MKPLSRFILDIIRGRLCDWAASNMWPGTAETWSKTLQHEALARSWEWYLTIQNKWHVFEIKKNFYWALMSLPGDRQGWWDGTAATESLGRSAQKLEDWSCDFWSVVRINVVSSTIQNHFNSHVPFVRGYTFGCNSWYSSGIYIQHPELLMQEIYGPLLPQEKNGSLKPLDYHWDVSSICNYLARSLQKKAHETSKQIWEFPKIVGFPPKSSILIGFSIINHHNPQDLSESHHFWKLGEFFCWGESGAKIDVNNQLDPAPVRWEAQQIFFSNKKTARKIWIFNDFFPTKNVDFHG